MEIYIFFHYLSLHAEKNGYFAAHNEILTSKFQSKNKLGVLWELTHYASTLDDMKIQKVVN